MKITGWKEKRIKLCFKDLEIGDLFCLVDYDHKELYYKTDECIFDNLIRNAISFSKNTFCYFPDDIPVEILEGELSIKRKSQ